jgi:hypothetical protein
MGFGEHDNRRRSAIGILGTTRSRSAFSDRTRTGRVQAFAHEFPDKGSTANVFSNEKGTPGIASIQTVIDASSLQLGPPQVSPEEKILLSLRKQLETERDWQDEIGERMQSQFSGSSEVSTSNFPKNARIEKLRNLLEKAVREERYEEAARIRDLMSRLK